MQKEELSQISAPKKKKWKKIVLIIIGSGVFLIVGMIYLSSLLGLFVKDTAPINDADLLLEKANVPDDENAYLDLIKLENIVYWPEEKEKSDILFSMIAGKTWNELAAKEILSRNVEAFKYFKEAVAKSKYQYPAHADPSKIELNTPVPHVGILRAMTRASVIKALYLAKQGQDKEAINESLTAVKIGQKMQESGVPSTIEYLVATAIKDFGMEAFQKIIDSSKLSSVELLNYIVELDPFYENEGGLINSFKGEYLTQSLIIDGLANKNEGVMRLFVNEEKDIGIEDVGAMFKKHYYFQPNKTKLLFAEDARENINQVNLPCGEVKQQPKIGPASLSEAWLVENAVGKALYNSYANTLIALFTKKCEDDLLVGVTQTKLALKAYKIDTGNYPVSLEELVPKYLLSVPRDTFDGGALKYSKDKKIIYSVGGDGKDSGGSEGEDWRSIPDPTFKLGF